ncbi:hypothetical protein MTO96_011023 [Rhipicephalus appendiculatus]
MGGVAQRVSSSALFGSLAGGTCCHLQKGSPSATTTTHTHDAAKKEDSLLAALVHARLVCSWVAQKRGGAERDVCEAGSSLDARRLVCS